MMTRNRISEWFDRGLEKKATHMIVICDTFDYDDYPVFVHTDEDCLKRFHSPGDMQRVMEVYDLREDKDTQMNEDRVFRLPKKVNL